MRAIDAGILVCGECHQLNRADGNEHPRCSRCGAKLHPRRPNSIARTWALLISAMILYVPANLLPIMTVNMLGKGSSATIMGGVVTLIQADMFPIALVVFVASIVVPTFKLVGIALLLYSVQRHQPMSARQRIMMYRFIEMGRALVDARYLRHRHPRGAGQFRQPGEHRGQSRRRRLRQRGGAHHVRRRDVRPRLIWDNTNLDDENE